MTMQNNIDILRRNIGWNMLQSKFQTVALEIDNQRPVEVPVAIAAHDSERRTDRFEIVGDGRFANIAQMPDLVRACRQLENRLWKFIMRIGENQYLHPARKFQTPISKPQTRPKTQTEKSAPDLLNIGVWNFLGAWALGFGALGGLPALADSVASPCVI